MLSEADYTYLYPFMSPQEIADEFGAHSKGARSIQKYYKNKGYLTQNDALSMIVNKSYAIADLSIDENTWAELVWSKIAQERILRKNVVWSRLRVIEDLYK